MEPDVIRHSFFCVISDEYQYRMGNALVHAGVKLEMETMHYLKCVQSAINLREPASVK